MGRASAFSAEPVNVGPAAWLVVGDYLLLRCIVQADRAVADGMTPLLHNPCCCSALALVAALSLGPVPSPTPDSLCLTLSTCVLQGQFDGRIFSAVSRWHLRISASTASYHFPRRSRLCLPTSTPPTGCQTPDPTSRFRRVSSLLPHSDQRQVLLGAAAPWRHHRSSRHTISCPSCKSSPLLRRWDTPRTHTSRHDSPNNSEAESR